MTTYHLDYLRNYANDTQVEINGRWVAVRPMDGRLTWRIRAAWLVLRGKADAFKWPEGQ